MFTIYHNNKLFSDLILNIVDADKTIILPVHKIILHANSPYFEKLLTNFTEASAKEITIKVPNVVIVENIIMSYYGIKSNQLITASLIKCYDFLLMPYEHLLDQINDYNELVDTIDYLGYNKKRINLLAEKMPKNYDIVSFPKELVMAIQHYRMCQFIIIGEYHGSITMLNLETAKIIWSVKYNAEQVKCLSVTSDKKKLIYGSFDHIIYILNIKNGELIKTIDTGAIIWSLAVIEDKIIIGQSDIIKIYDIMTGCLVKTLTDSSINGVTIFEIIDLGDNKIITYCYNVINIWDITTGKIVRILGKNHNLKNPIYLVLSSDRKKLIFRDNNKFINILEIETDKMIATLSGHNYNINSICITSDDTKIISGDTNNIYIWDISNELTSGIQPKLFVHKMTYRSILSVSLDNTKIILADDRGDTKIWDIMTGKLINIFHGSELITSTLVIQPLIN